MNIKVEEISKNDNTKADNIKTERFKVPGGWIVRSSWYISGQGGAGITQTFISDPYHTWIIGTESNKENPAPTPRPSPGMSVKYN